MIKGLSEPQGETTAWQKSAEGIVVGGNELREVGMSHPDEGPNGPQPNGLGKWSWLSKSMFLSA